MPPSLQFDPTEPRDWHYLSAIPLAPSSSGRPTSSSSPTTLSGTVVGTGSAAAPDVPCTPQLNSTPVMSGGATFHMQEAQRYSPPDRARLPLRPRRPSRPEQGLMFNAPSSPLPLESAYGGEGVDEGIYVSRSQAESTEVSPQKSSLPTPQTRAEPFSNLIPSARFSASSHPQHRKPVPAYLEDDDAYAPSRQSRTPSPDPRTPGRLSVGGFEALLARRAEAGRAAAEDEGRVVWSPRIHLGLDSEGVEAREARMRWDEQARSVAMEQDMGDLRASPSLLATPPRDRLTPGPHLAAEHVFVSPRGTRARVRQTTVEDLRPQPAHATPRTSSAIDGWLSGHRRFLSVDEGADADVRAAREGPHLRRGSVRLSELAGDDGTMGDSNEDERLDPARVAAMAATSRAAGPHRLQTGSSVPHPRHSSSGSRSVLRRGDVRCGSGSRKARACSECRAMPDQFEVVVLDPREKELVEPAGDGNWERLRTETLCRSEQMTWSMCDFEGWFPRLLYLLYPFAIFAHVPATLFFDYNAIYLLCQLARYPSVPSPTSRNIAMRSLVDVPHIEASTGWWVAVAVYSACTAAWFFGVFLWRELGREGYGRWQSGDRSVEIEKVYAGAASYNLACLRSYSHFSFFWRVRLAPFRRSSTIAQSVKGPTWFDGVRESADWYRQNWPTVLMLLPRAGLMVVIFLLFSTTAYGTSTSTTARDTAYFGANGTLTRFASGVLLANAAWAAWRTLVWLVAVVAVSLPRLSACVSRKRRSKPYSNRYHLSQPLALPLSPDTAKSTPPTSRHPSVLYATWRTRRQRRIRAAILACLGSTPLSTSSATFSPQLAQSPYVLGYRPKTVHDTFDGEKVDSDVQVLRVEHDPLHRSGSAPAIRGKLAVPQGPPFLSDRKYLGPGAYREPPRQEIAPSPLIHFSPATPSPPRFVQPPLTAGQATGTQPRRSSLVTGGDGLVGGDVGESLLHRRMRSLPQDENQGLLVFPSMGQNVSSRAVPTRAILGPDVAQPYASVGKTAPRPLLPSIMISPRPPLVSRFSAFSSRGDSSASTPLTERDMNTSREPSHTPPSTSSSPREANRSAVLHRQLTAGQTERTRLSQRLFDEVQRAQEEEDAQDELERQALHLHRISEASSAPTGLSAGDDARWSQLSATEHSDESTVRGAVSSYAPDAPSPVALTAAAIAPVASLGTPPAEGDEDTSEATSTPEREGLGVQSFVPLRLARATGAESVALSEYNSPDLTGGDDSGQFEGGASAWGRTSFA